MQENHGRWTRRRFVTALGAIGSFPAWGAPSRGAQAQPAKSPLTLRASATRLSLLGPEYPLTSVWAYNDWVPGPVLRVRQGERLRVDVVNDLDEPTTVHWHGVRVPNAMDGVPYLTQEPIAARGGRFTYEFTCRDAGTFWYHPHLHGNVQVDMGLAGALIVEERERPAVDREVLWVLDDWRMRRDATIAADFNSVMDATHAGRIGNTVTINGTLPDRFLVAAGERIRLRLLNVANARIFALSFEGHASVVIAHDGMPCAPYAPDGGRVVLGPGMRADLILDATGQPGATFRVIDDFFPTETYEVVKLAYTQTKRRARRLPEPPRLAGNPVSEPNLSAAERHVITFAGGVMGEEVANGYAWAINGQSNGADDHSHAPLLLLRRGRSYVLELVNDTSWWHPIHLHGHSFRVVAANGRAIARKPLVDTALLPPRESVEIAFVADNPGNWMFHCHVLEHQASGMMATIRVA